jgi:xanthine dehydrogenase large subunit
MKTYDSIQHVRGESKFVDDLFNPEGLLYGYVYYSSIAHGKIVSINLKKALKYAGVRGVFTAEDIPGENQIGGIVPDEVLLAGSKVDFIGQPIALVVADTKLAAKSASKLIDCKIEEYPAVFDPRIACEKGELIIPPRIFSLGDVNNAWSQCEYIVEGKTETGGQEHLYIETQGAVAIPVEGGGIKIYSSTQNPTAVQKVSARILNVPMHKIEVDVPRLGGGFGGKEDQATAWAALAALAASKLQRPVKIILPRQEDMRLTGKRNPYSSDFKIGLNKEGMILAYEVTFYQNAGAAADLSPAILDRTLFHCTNSYYIPNVKATAYSCRTNLLPNTAFRGFGGPQGMFVIESAINRAAEVMGISAHEIQRKNLLKEGDEFPYGQRTEHCRAIRCFEEAEQRYDFKMRKNYVEQFNQENKLVKKGITVMPVCFGISFTTTFMNQASALVHVYTDGSVRISTAAVEMGQGVNAKISVIASKVFSIDISRIKIDSTNTTRIANTSPTAASKGADLNGYAAMKACELILERLKKTACNELKFDDPKKVEIREEHIFYDGNRTPLTWNKLIQAAYLRRVSLSAHAHHATTDIYFDKEKAKGKPFAYHVYGTAIIEATVDCLRGTYKIDSVKVVHDFGSSLHSVVDRGQAEGAIVQGIGWMTIEEVMFDGKGKLMTDALSTYKVPDIQSAPKDMEVHFLEDAANPFGPFNSKAIGEPPLMYGIGAFFAIRNAMKAFRPERQFDFVAPITNERVLLTLYPAERFSGMKPDLAIDDVKTPAALVY